MGPPLQLLLRSRGLPTAENAGVDAFHGKESLCGSGSGVGHDDDSWAEAGTCATDPGSIANRLAHIEALAAMVAGSLCAQLLLESGSSPVHASGMRADTAFVVVGKF